MKYLYEMAVDTQSNNDLISNVLNGDVTKVRTLLADKIGDVNYRKVIDGKRESPLTLALVRIQHNSDQ